MRKLLVFVAVGYYVSITSIQSTNFCQYYTMLETIRKDVITV